MELYSSSICNICWLVAENNSQSTVMALVTVSLTSQSHRHQASCWLYKELAPLTQHIREYLNFQTEQIVKL